MNDSTLEYLDISLKRDDPIMMATCKNNGAYQRQAARLRKQVRQNVKTNIGDCDGIWAELEEADESSSSWSTITIMMRKMAWWLR